MSIRRVGLMRILFVTWILDEHCLGSEVGRDESSEQKKEDILSDDEKIVYHAA